MSNITAVTHSELTEERHPVPDERRRGLSPDTVATLKVLAMFLGVVVLALPLTYLAKEEAAPPGSKSTEPPKQEPIVASVPEKSPPTVARAPAMPTDMRAAVIARVQKLVNQGDYQRAIDVADTYLAGSELHHLWNLRVLANESMAANREQEILKELASIPGRQYKLNRDKYAQLVALNPDEPRYYKKLQYYQEKYLEHETRLSRSKR